MTYLGSPPLTTGAEARAWSGGRQERKSRYRQTVDLRTLAVSRHEPPQCADHSRAKNQPFSRFRMIPPIHKFCISP